MPVMPLNAAGGGPDGAPGGGAHRCVALADGINVATAAPLGQDRRG